MGIAVGDFSDSRVALRKWFICFRLDSPVHFALRHFWSLLRKEPPARSQSRWRNGNEELRFVGSIVQYTYRYPCLFLLARIPESRCGTTRRSRLVTAQAHPSCHRKTAKKSWNRFKVIRVNDSDSCAWRGDLVVVSLSATLTS